MKNIARGAEKTTATSTTASIATLWTGRRTSGSSLSIYSKNDDREKIMDCSILNEIIIGRVEPRIYAFSTNTVPNYLKVGDTYRPVDIRLKEWMAHYPTLKSEFEVEAKIGEVFFRDYAVHAFLEKDNASS